jgi:hypothetical protein
MGVRSTLGGGVRVEGTANLFLPEAEVGISDIQ